MVADERNADAVPRRGLHGELLTVPDERLFDAAPAPAPTSPPEDPALIIFTSGTAGEPKPIRHGQRYLPGQRVQAEHWFGARAGDLAWCTAASGWSKSARNVFVAPWLRGATALLHDARFDPDERLDVIEREGVNVLCMAPTEYRAIAKRTELRRCRRCATRSPPASRSTRRSSCLWQEAVGVAIHDGYGQTETGALTGMPIGQPVRPGSMGQPLPGIRAWIDSDGDGVASCSRPRDGADLLPRRPGRRLAHRRPRAPRTRTATSGSRAAPTT